jgi:hypothetical protein
MAARCAAAQGQLAVARALLERAAAIEPHEAALADELEQLTRPPAQSGPSDTGRPPAR